VSRLATHPDIVGLKDTSRDFASFLSVQERTSDSFSLLMGAPELSIPAFDHGADGIVAAPSNYAPETVATIYESYRSGDRQRALSIFRSDLFPFVEAMQSLPTIAVTKYLLQLRGHDVGDPVIPNPTLSGTDRELLDECYERILGNDS
jgi:4-hydroxy-tetrahydrodipicolinate synthase